jgi:hypothetical protein
MVGEVCQRGGMSASFPILLSQSPTAHPIALGRTGDLDKEASRDGGSGNELRTGLGGCNNGINERLHEEGVFTSLSPPIFGTTEVTRELD